jgi:hypothetical protein
MSWLKEVAYLNMFEQLVTLDIFQLPISLLNLYADENIAYIFLTLDTSQELKSELNTFASPNM